MYDGLWSAEFFVPPSGTGVFGSGIAVLNNGKIRGGDASYYYIGSYRIDNGIFIADVSIIYYSGPYNNILRNGVKQTNVTVSGIPDSNEFEVTGQSESLQKQISVRLERLYNL
jgi:hypothetical protein